MKQKSDVDELAREYVSKSLDELTEMELAIKLARERKAEMKKDEVPKEDVEHLRAAWKLCQRKQSIEMPITVVIEVTAGDSDPCSVYPEVASPDYMMDWDAYDLVTHNPDVQKQVFEAVKELQDLLTQANKIHNKFSEKYDIPAESFL